MRIPTLALTFVLALGLAAPAAADFGFHAAYGGSGEAPGEFRSPQRIASDAAGTVFVADVHNDRVQRLAPDGRVLAVWGSRGAGPGQFDGIAGIAVDAAGTVWVADNPAGGARVQRFGADGAHLGQFGLAQLGAITGLAADATGHLWVSNDRGLDGERVDRFTLDGTHVGSFEAATPGDLAADAAGNVYVVTFSGVIEKHDANGALVAEWPGSGDPFAGIAVDAGAGVVYVTGPDAQVQRYDLAGASLGAFPTAGTPADVAPGIWVSTRGGDQLLRYGEGAAPGAPADFAASPAARIELGGSAKRACPLRHDGRRIADCTGFRYATVSWSVGCNAAAALTRRDWEVTLRTPAGDTYTPIGAAGPVVHRATATADSAGSVRVILGRGIRVAPHVEATCSSRRQPAGEPVSAQGAARGTRVTVAPGIFLGQIQLARRGGRLLGVGQAPRISPKRLRRGQELRVFLSPSFDRSLSGRGYRRVFFVARGAGVRKRERLSAYQFEDAGPRILVRPRKRGTLRIWLEVAGVRSSNGVALKIR